MAAGAETAIGGRAGANLAAALDRALDPWKGEGPPYTLLFSGGVDSGLLAWELRASPRPTALTIGRPGSTDLEAGRRAAQELGVPWRAVELSDEFLGRTQERIGPELRGISPTLAAVLLSLAAGLLAAPTRTVLWGQGVDELFLGYAHFRGLAPGDAEARATDDLRLLLEEAQPRAERIARTADRELVAPYLDAKFVRAALAVPLADRLPGAEPKAWFRRWAIGRGLPETIALRPKRALQYGTGIARWTGRGRSGL